MEDCLETELSALEMLVALAALLLCGPLGFRHEIPSLYPMSVLTVNTLVVKLGTMNI